MPWCNVTMYVAPPSSDIARNATFGSTPLIQGRVGTVGTAPYQSTAFSCSASAKMVVVAVALGNETGTVNQPLTVQWVGGTPANASALTKRADGQNSGNNHSGEIWTASVTGALASVQIEVTAAASSASSAETFVIDVLDNASTTVGVSNTGSVNGGSTAPQTTLAGLTAGSWRYVVGAGEGPETWPAGADTTELDQRDDTGSTAVAAVGINTAGASGSQTLGWTTNVSYGGWAALEILKA